MISHTKRYMITFQKWGKMLDSYGKHGTLKDFLNIERIECDTLDEVNEFTKLIEEEYENIVSPDALSNRKLRPKGKHKSTNRYYDEHDWIYDDNHFWWGYAVMDFENESVIKEAHDGFKNHEHPMKSLEVKDIYFRKDDEIPDGYKWDAGEYAGWLQFRWGNGENAINKVRARKAAEEENRKKKAELKRLEIEQEEASEEDIKYYIVNSEYDDMQDEYDKIADEQLVKYNLEKYGW